MADYIDQNVEKIADTLRDVLASSQWLPEAIRPRPSPPPAPPIVAIPTSTLESIQNWISRHKILTGVILLTTGTIAYKTYRSHARLRKSRRAKRSRSGGRMEVVVVAGSPSLPLTRSLSLDLERKGFVVFIVCNSHEDEIMVNNLSRPDIRPLSIDTTDVSSLPYPLTLIACILSCDADVCGKQTAPKCWWINRTLRTLPPNTPSCRSRSEATPPLSQGRPPHPLTKLPDLAHRHHPALQLRRPLQHPSLEPDLNHPVLPSPPDGPSQQL